ncbi:hypothetical protein VW29_07800 [Devosia limi DSM 17137]|uniref:Sel1 repeat-containing protein n=1 Tax=Devosia limi DSM 17137 TaxID=1121477 RepID=A0A0F5LS00_9HYPH|nr:SEL1-like repeat protein [Devosia limi]KKB85056.1 hypothetical protein VW29_07800 [Devosia limi DSM 17137]SHF38952.1 Sel1 repeat-containing protein [Devosia limi DSM 17137]
MARAFPLSDNAELALDPQPGEWQALRGELVALLDQVEGRYAPPERVDPAYEGLAARVRNLRDQVVRPEPAVRRREALRTVKRAVDRFSERDEALTAGETDSLASAIAEIRSRQFSTPAAALGRRPVDSPEFRDLAALVGGLSGRLEQLEGELKQQRASNGSVREVASQVEQLTHVVELLAGAVGETGQVKRLEAQIAGLAQLIGDAPKVDLSAINTRLDDVSATVGKLAELQAQQMEREIVRADRSEAQDGDELLAPAMHAIEKSVRNVYDRIDAIEKSVSLSANEFEQLTSEMASFTQAMRDRDAAPDALVAKIDALTADIGRFEGANGDVAGLKDDISALRDVLTAGMEPRFNRIESQIEALSEQLATPRAEGASKQIETQLKLLMTRMDETGAQLDGLARLYGQDEPSVKPDFEALAQMVAEKTSTAFSSKAPAVAMVSDSSMAALETRMTALFNTAGKDTAERLARLETALNDRQNRTDAAKAEIARAEPGKAELPRPKLPPIPTEAPVEEADEQRSALDAMLAALSNNKGDAMPANPADDAPLIDPGFKDNGPIQVAMEAKTAPSQPLPEATPSVASVAEPVVEPPAPAITAKPAFDPASVVRPPRPQSSLTDGLDPFAPEAQANAEPATAEPMVNQNSTSTFVAAARRAQRAKQENEGASVGASANSLISRALARVMPTQPAPATDEMAEAPAKPAREPKEPRATKAPKVDAVAPEPFGLQDQDVVQTASFLTRYRRPLLLAATLAAVSMLALNLVLQRTAPSRADVEPASAAATAPAMVPMSAEPMATDDSAALVSPTPRVIEMVDNTATGSINPPTAMSFSKRPEMTPMPDSLTAATGSEMSALDAPTLQAPTPGGGAIAEAFELPPEALGPLELRQAAANGEARAQFEIAAIYSEGRAVPQDFAAAATWYERAAAQGFVPAQYRLGNLYEVGSGVDKDIEIAKLWYQRGAEAGNRMAMHNLAALYAGGELGEQQFETAAQWFEQAAALGMTDSQFNLGMLYARGLGVKQNLEQSYLWFALAARNGDVDAGKARDDIVRSLSAETVKTLDETIAAWKADPIELAANFAPIGTWSPSFDPGEVIASKPVVSKVQEALTKLGYDIGTPDGMAGPKTAEAIKAFERGTGMSESGLVNPRLLAVLGSQPV